MIVERTEHPSWLSNAYLVGDGEGGHGVLVDSNGINQPLIEAVERSAHDHARPRHPSHADHVVTCEEDARRFGVPVLGAPACARRRRPRGRDVADGDVVRSGELEIRA